MVLIQGPDQLLAPAGSRTGGAGFKPVFAGSDLTRVTCSQNQGPSQTGTIVLTSHSKADSHVTCSVVSCWVC